MKAGVFFGVVVFLLFPVLPDNVRQTPERCR